MDVYYWKTGEFKYSCLTKTIIQHHHHHPPTHLNDLRMSFCCTFTTLPPTLSPTQTSPFASSRQAVSPIYSPTAVAVVVAVGIAEKQEVNKFKHGIVAAFRTVYTGTQQSCGWQGRKRRESHRFTLNRRLYCVCINLDQIVSVVVGCHATHPAVEQCQCKCQPSSQAKKLGNRKTIIIIIKWVGGNSTRQKQERTCISRKESFCHTDTPHALLCLGLGMSAVVVGGGECKRRFYDMDHK